MTTVTFCGGVGEIGGNKFLVRYGSTSVFLDFGRNFAREKEFYEEPFLRPRSKDHLVKLGIIPQIPGIYKEEDEDAVIDGIVLSHAHTDHGDSVRYLKDDFPIYCGATTKQIILAREYSGISQGEYAIGKYPWDKDDKCYRQECYKAFEELKDGSSRSVGDMTVTQFGVDHSTPGACGTILESPDSTIVYTGDIRVHGRRKDLTERFVEATKEHEPDALLIEGTNLLEGRMDSEEDVLAKATEIAKSTKGMVMTGFANADLDRARTFLEVARSSDRKLILSAKQAYIIHSLRNLGGQDLLSLEDDDVAIFLKSKKRRAPFERELEAESSYEILEAADVREVQRKALLAFTLYDMNETFEIQPMAGSSYILSASEPFNEEMEISYEKLCNWLKHLGMPLYHAHASGHARPFELRKMIAEIAPRIVIPIHTSSPEHYQRYISDLGFEVRLPADRGELTVT